MTARIDEIAPHVHRISIYVPDFDLEFSHFLVKDEEPLLYHTGMRRMFPELRKAVARILDPASIRWIGFSHFEVDECGALNDWLTIAPRAQAFCGVVGTLVNLGDFAVRPARALAPGETLDTGAHRFRWQPTPHLPHGWDAGMLFEETRRTLFCSDLFFQGGKRELLTEGDLLARSRETLIETQQGPLSDFAPYSTKTRYLLGTLADLAPQTLAIMHGSSYAGDCAGALRGLADVFEEVLAPVPGTSRGGSSM